MILLILMCLSSILIVLAGTKLLLNKYNATITVKDIALLIPLSLSAVILCFSVIYSSFQASSHLAEVILTIVIHILLLILMIVASAVDIHIYKVPNIIPLALTILCVAVIFIADAAMTDIDESIIMRLTSVLMIVAVFALPVIKKQIGMGDFKILMPIAFLLSLSLMLKALLYALISSAVYGLVILVITRTFKKHVTRNMAHPFIPFIPFLTIGIVYALCQQ